MTTPTHRGWHVARKTYKHFKEITPCKWRVAPNPGQVLVKSGHSWVELTVPIDCVAQTEEGAIGIFIRKYVKL